MTKLGREELRLLGALQALKLDPVLHLAVQHDRWHGGQYEIDIAIKPLAIEVHTSLSSPWQPVNLYERTMFFLRNGWYQAYVWLQKGAEFEPELLDTLVEHHQKVLAGYAPAYVVFGPGGEKLHVGDLELHVATPPPPIVRPTPTERPRPRHFIPTGPEPEEGVAGQ